MSSSSSSSSSCTCRADNSRKNNVRTGRAGVSKITNVALTPVVSGSRERSKLYGASRRMARARHGRDGPIVARSSLAYQSLYTYTRTHTYMTHMHTTSDQRHSIPTPRIYEAQSRTGITQSITRRDRFDDDYDGIHNRGIFSLSLN